MASRYWVGGSASWDSTAGTKWATTSGGAGGAAVPTSADSVFFDANSGAVTVTIGGGTVSAASINCTGFTGTLTGTSQIDVYGSFTLVNSMTYTHTGTVRFLATGTLTTAGKTFSTLQIQSTVTLGDALNTGTRSITFTAGGLTTNNYSVNSNTITLSTSGTGKTLTLGSSTVTLTNNFTVTETNPSLVTINAGTSTINVGGTTFNGGGKTYYNVVCTPSSSLGIYGVNTFNNLTITCPAVAGITNATFYNNQVINGTLNISGTSVKERLFVKSSTFTQTSLKIATLAAVSNCDFSSITVDQTGTVKTITGTSLGDCGNNNYITFDAPKTVYRVGSNTTWVGSNSWALSSGGAGADANFPLAQDTAIVDNNSGSSVATDKVNIGTLDCSSRTTSFTLSASLYSANFYGDFTLSSSVTVSSAITQYFTGASTQTITTAGKNLSFPVTIDSNATIQLNGACTLTNTITLNEGTLDLNGYDLTATRFSSSTSTVRSISFGVNKIILTGNNATIWTLSSAANFTYTGTPTVELNYSGATGTRAISTDGTVTETKAVSFNITAGTDTVSVASNVKSLDFTGFSGSWATASLSIYENLIISSGMTIVGGASAIIFAATSGTQTLTTNGKILDFPVTKSGVGATLQSTDDVTIGSSRLFSLSGGTANFSTYKLTTGQFSSVVNAVREFNFGSNEITITGDSTTVISLSLATGNNLTFSGTPVFNCTYSGSAGTRGISTGSALGWKPASIKISAGSDIVDLGDDYYNSLDFTGFSGSVNWTSGVQARQNITFSPTMSFGTVGNLRWEPTGTYYLTTNGLTLPFSLTVGGNGIAKLQDTLILTGNLLIQNVSGPLEFDANDQNITTYAVFTNTPQTRTIKMGSGTWTLTGYGTVWDFGTTTGLTFNKGTANIVLTDTSTNARTFIGGGLTYNGIVIGGTTGTSTLTFTGANTFSSISSTKTVAHTITFTAGTTTTVGNWGVYGSPGNLVTIRSTSAGSPFTLTKSSAGPVYAVDYLNVKDSTATPGSVWYAGANSVDSGNNSGWIFTSSPILPGNFFAILLKR